MAEPTLYDWGPSPFCLKVRAILDHKGITYRRRRVTPFDLAQLNLRGTGKVPALELDGELIFDSSRIALALDRRHPTPPLIPDDRRLAAQSQILEDWADEWLYWLGIYFQWQESRGAARVKLAFRSPPERAILPIYRRRVRAQLRGQGIGRKSSSDVQDDLQRALDAVEHTLGSQPWLLGDQPYLADFAVVAQLLYLQRTPVGGEAVAQRPALTRLLERFRDLRGHASKVA